MIGTALIILLVTSMALFGLMAMVRCLDATQDALEGERRRLDVILAVWWEHRERYGESSEGDSQGVSNSSREPSRDMRNPGLPEPSSDFAGGT